MGYYIGTAKRVPQKQKARLQLKKHNYFNFAESKREAEETHTQRSHREVWSAKATTPEGGKRPGSGRVQFAFRT
jgi:hypothetical protein